jgi:hypothetical protein
MESGTRSTFAGQRFVLIAFLFCWFSGSPITTAAQGSPGQDAVYNSTTGVVGSSSFIDASMFGRVARTLPDEK